MKRKFITEGKLTTLGRLIVTIIVSSLCALAGIILFDTINKHSIVKKKNAVIAQQVQIAMLRISKELSALETISAATDTMIRYKRHGATGQETHEISWAKEGEPIRIDGDVLIEHVKSFSLKYFDKYDAAPSTYSSATSIIEYALEIRDYNNISHVFSDRVVI